MVQKNSGLTGNGSSPYKASLTREQYLFYEMRTTAKLVCQGLPDEQVIEQIMKENMFQYPTEKSVRKVALACINRLKAMNDVELVQATASRPVDISKQICLYAMMKQSRLVWDFMLTVIGEKYRLQDLSFGRMDLNVYFMRLQEQDDVVASWSDSTLTKLKQVLTKILVENGYLDDSKTDHLNPVWLNPILENAIRSHNDNAALPAFNCFS